ncbi:hypothetical protein B0X67_00135 [Helicobacter pylori]|nr:hypothetical protein B0X67_00135 [Helicobacter pylori]
MERFCNHSPQKLKGFFKKNGVIFEFWGVCMRLLKIIARLARDSHSFKKASKRFLKLSPTLY